MCNAELSQRAYERTSCTLFEQTAQQSVPTRGMTVQRCTSKPKTYTTRALRLGRRARCAYAH
eukprot:8074989-Lingulodinium_polyedra.AAC.1